MGKSIGENCPLQRLLSQIVMQRPIVHFNFTPVLQNFHLNFFGAARARSGYSCILKSGKVSCTRFRKKSINSTLALSLLHSGYNLSTSSTSMGIACCSAFVIGACSVDNPSVLLVSSQAARKNTISNASRGLDCIRECVIPLNMHKKISLAPPIGFDSAVTKKSSFPSGSATTSM